MKRTGGLIELHKKGKALVVTDIHGNLEDFERYMKIWGELKRKGKENHLIIAGDYIHAMPGQKVDYSINILESVIKLEKSDNVHVLLGNHEWSHLSGVDVYKAGINQKIQFELNLVKKFGFEKYEKRMEIYNKFFAGLPIAVKTGNGIFISHAAPAKSAKTIQDIIDATKNGYLMNNNVLNELLWNRYPDNYNDSDIENFLKIVGCKVSVVGHTPVDGYEVIGRQIILSSSFSRGRKAYLEIDLEKEITGVEDVVKMIKFLEPE